MAHFPCSLTIGKMGIFSLDFLCISLNIFKTVRDHPRYIIYHCEEERYRYVPLKMWVPLKMLVSRKNEIKLTHYINITSYLHFWSLFMLGNICNYWKAYIFMISGFTANKPDLRNLQNVSFLFKWIKKGGKTLLKIMRWYIFMWGIYLGNQIFLRNWKIYDG